MDATTCVKAEAVEMNNSGYKTAEATSFCTLDSTNDPCCAAFPAPPKKSLTCCLKINAAPAAAGGLTGTALYIVVGVSLVVLIAVGITIWCCRKKRGHDEYDDDDYDDDSRNGGGGGGYGMAKRANQRPYSEFDDGYDNLDQYDDRGRDGRYHHDKEYDSYDDDDRGKKPYKSDDRRDTYARGFGGGNGGRGRGRDGYESDDYDDRRDTYGGGGGRGYGRSNRGGGGNGGGNRGGNSRW
ncbi:UNVERIFIED_CONTAM: hypothetical protein HDU68_001552 [Siphonaria sp. JEL0065]|nr:hypothetical protein HDU68_001552 [Siphonaria sp. JEL0065]